MLTQEKLIELINYDSETGIFTWKNRSENYFCNPGYCKAWNKRYAGKKTGNMSSTGCLQICIDDVRYMAHRLAWLYIHGDMNSECIDHINGDRTDNRLSNLRPATFVQNLMNAPSIAKRETGVRGVYWDKRGKCWRAACSISRKRVWLGKYYSLFDAAAARKSYEANNYAEYSRSIGFCN